jgi:hypothetical protein
LLGLHLPCLAHKKSSSGSLLGPYGLDSLFLQRSSALSGSFDSSTHLIVERVLANSLASACH